MSEFPQSLYLSRIGLTSAPEATLAGLKAIHQAQHRSIAFENFDVASGLGIDPLPQGFINKLLQTKRGGYCFELNGLLGLALEHFGFDVQKLLARVHLSGQPSARTHLLLLVNLDGQQWLVDSGFGSQTPRAPVPLVFDQTFPIDYQTFRLQEDKHYGVMLEGLQNDEWIKLYSFDFTHVCDSDILCGNHYTATNPDSHFVSSCVAALPTEEGIITLLNQTLRIRNADGVAEQELNPDDYIAAVRRYFGIELDYPVTALNPLQAE